MRDIYSRVSGGLGFCVRREILYFLPSSLSCKHYPAPPPHVHLLLQVKVIFFLSPKLVVSYAIISQLRDHSRSQGDW